MKRALCLPFVLLAACGSAEQPAPAPVETPAPIQPAKPDVQLPGLSNWPSAMLNPSLPALHIRISADSGFATRTSGDWVSHAGDSEVLDALRTNAGEVDLDTGRSDLQVVLRADRAARWEKFLGVLEMMRMVGCERLLVETSSGRVSLPLRIADATGDVGTATLERSAEGARITVQVGSEQFLVDGADFGPSLKRWAESRPNKLKLLAIRLPLDEPFQTLFRVLDALGALRPGAFSFGG